MEKRLHDIEFKAIHMKPRDRILRNYSVEHRVMSTAIFRIFRIRRSKMINLHQLKVRGMKLVGHEKAS